MGKSISRAFFSLFLVISITFIINPSVALGVGGATKAKQDAWINQAAGNSYHSDGRSDYQCVGVSNAYEDALFGTHRWPVSQGFDWASDILERANAEYFDIIYNNPDPNLIPQYGDIAVWNGYWTSDGWSGGHVAVVVSATPTSLVVLEQNYAGPWVPCALRSFGASKYNNIRGWLRPKLDADIIQPPAPPPSLSSTKSVFTPWENVVLNWTASPRATSYKLWVAKGSVQIIGGADYTGTSADLGRYSAGSYSAQVVAYNSAGQAQSNYISFDVVDPVTRPTLVKPDHVGRVARGPMQFSWAAVSGSDGYAIELCSENPGNTNDTEPSPSRIGAAVLSGGASTRFQGDASGLTVGATYWWRVIAVRKGKFLGAFSAPRAFVVASNSTTRPILNNPHHGQPVTNGPFDFTWTFSPPEANSPVAAYEIEICSERPENPNGRTPSKYRIAAANVTGGHSVVYHGNTKGLVPGRHYWWRVIGIADNNQLLGEFSDAHYFTAIKAPLVRPALSTPVALSRAARGPMKFTWAQVDGADGYAIELCSANPGNTDSVNPSNSRIGAAMLSGGSTTTFQGDASGLNPGATYWWRVIAVKNGKFLGAFSSPKAFIVVSNSTTRPLLNDPHHGQSVTNGPFDFTWTFTPPAANNSVAAYGIEICSERPENPNGRTPSKHRIAAATVTGGRSAVYHGNTKGLIRGKHYWWRVIGIADNNQVLGEFSDAHYFTAR